MTAETVGGRDLTQASADIVVLTVLPEEYAAVLACLSDVVPLRGAPDKPNIHAWRQGLLPSSRYQTSFSVVVGKGTPTTSHSALATAHAIELFTPRYVVFVGVAGGFDRDGQRHGDVVVSSVVYGYEYGKIDTGGFLPRSSFTYRCDEGLVCAADAAIALDKRWGHDEENSGRAPRARTGAIASGDKVIDDPDESFFAAVKKSFPGLLAVEMEGAGVGAAVHGAQASRTIGFLLVRGISDMPHTKAPGEGPSTAERDRWKKTASNNAARFFRHLVDTEWPAPPRGTAIGIARLEETTAAADAPDSATARREFLAWAAGVSLFAERRRFAGAGVLPEQLASLELEHVYVEPDLETEEWRRHGAQRERELAKRLEASSLAEAAARDLRAQYLRLTASEHRAGATQSGRRSLRKVVDRVQLLVICGDAGMGKTTLLQHLDRRAVDAALRAADAPIPVRFSVAGFPADGSATLGTYALAQLRARWADLPESTREPMSAAVVEHLEGGRVLLLVDGLNEALAAKRAVVNAIDAYIETHPTARVVLTTRRQAYDVPLRGRVEVWHLAPLDDGQRRRFLEQNTSGLHQMESVGRLFEENTRLAELGGNPFFLVLGSLLAQADLAGVRHRAQLYEKAFDRLWRDVGEDGIEWRRAVFAHVAAQQRADGQATDPGRRLERRMDVARAAQTEARPETTGEVRRQALEDAGLFVREVGGDLSFFHPSFQEYLAAVYLTREPIGDVPARLHALRSDPDSAEVVLLALGRLAHVLRESEETARALRELSDRDDATETISGSGLLTAWQAIRDGVTSNEVVVGEVLARLTTRVREIPDSRASEPFVLALLSVERTATVRAEVLDELLLLVEADHPVPWLARHYALQAIARSAPREPQAAAACRRAWERFDRQDLPEGVAAAMLVSGAELDESMLRPLGRALEQGWLEPIAEALARDVARLGAPLQRLAASAIDHDAAVCATLALLALRDEDLVEAALVRHLEKHDPLAGKAIAYLANRQDSVLSRVLDRASESEDRARQVARALGRQLAPAVVLKRVRPWLLGARLDCARAWMNAIGEGQAEGKAEEALHDSLRAALTGPPATAARAAALLTARMPFRAVGDVAERLAAAAPAIITRVDGAAACELLGALAVARLAEPALELLKRLVRTGDLATLESVLRNVTPYDPAVRKVVVGRMTESAADRDHHAVLACAHFLASAKLAQAEVVAALASVGGGAPLQLQTEAALLLVRHGVRDVGVARTLARALAAAVDQNQGFRLSDALGEVVRSGNLRDLDTFRLLLDGFMAEPGTAPFGGCDALRALVQNDDALFELALDALVTAADPDRKQRAIALVWTLLLKWLSADADADDDRLLRRFEARLAGSPMLFHELEHIVNGRPSWYEALSGALANVDRNAEDALHAAQRLSRVLGAAPNSDGATTAAATEGARDEAPAPSEVENGILRSRIVAVLRQLLAHDDAYIALQAATELVFLGDGDVQDALHRALAGPPLVAVSAAMALYGLGAADDRVVAALLRCLLSNVELRYFVLPELHIARARLDAFDQELHRQAADSPASNADEDAAQGDHDGDVLGEPVGLARMVAAADRVSLIAAWLLVALRRTEVVPVLLNWIDGENDRQRDDALAMLTTLGAEREPRALDWRLRQLRDCTWAFGAPMSHWLWLNAPERLDHLDVLVDLLTKEQWHRETLRAWLTDCCDERADWADRLAFLVESRPHRLVLELTPFLARAGRMTESLAQRAVLGFCEADPVFLRPLLADLVGAINACAVLAAAWRERLAGGKPASRVAAASLLWRWDPGPPTALRDAMAGAFRSGLDDEDLCVRLDALLGLEHLGLVDDDVTLAAKRILDETFGEAPARIIYGETADQAQWESQALTIRRSSALSLLSWGRHAEAATSWLVGALRTRWPPCEFQEIFDALRARGGHDQVLRSSLDEWLRDHPAGTPGESAIIERAQRVGVSADVLDRRALAALGGSSPPEARAMEMLFGKELADDHSGSAFSHRHSSDLSERAVYWAQRIAEGGIDVARALGLLGEAVGATPATLDLLVAPRAKDTDDDVLANVAELVRRRPTDGFLAELGRAFLWRWVAQRMAAG